FQAEDGIRDRNVTGVQTCALPIYQGGPCIELECSLPSEVTAIFPFVDKFMLLIRKCGCVPEGESDVEIALREARANAIIHGNHRSEEHTSELQSRFDLVCRLLLEK